MRPWDDGHEVALAVLDEELQPDDSGSDHARVDSGGWPAKVLCQMLRLSGLEVIATADERRPSFVARIPQSGMAICVGPEVDLAAGDYGGLPNDGSASGILTFRGGKSCKCRKPCGHAVAYVRDAYGVRVLDSHGHVRSTVQEARQRLAGCCSSFCDAEARATIQPVYTCHIPGESAARVAAAPSACSAALGAEQQCKTAC